MNKIEVKICIDVDDNSQIVLLNEFLLKIGKAPGIDFSKKREKKEKAVTAAPVVEALAKSEDAPTAQTGIKIEDIRELVQEKATTGNRDKIKAKLTELRAPNVTKLDPAKYEEFVEFLKTLA